MAKFDVWTKNNSKVIVKKVKNDKDSMVNGATYLATITSSILKVAEKQAQSMFDQGRIKIPAIKISQPVVKKEIKEITKPKVEKKAIYCDFNGVLDVPELKEKCTERNDAFKLPAITCPHRVIKLLKMAIKHNADIIVTSLYRLHGFSTYHVIFGRCILNSGIQEYIDFYNDNEDIIDELVWTKSTPSLSARTNEIRAHIKDHLYSHYVVFEDEHFIESDLNPIMVDSMTGIEDKHFEKADSILSESF